MGMGMKFFFIVSHYQLEMALLLLYHYRFTKMNITKKCHHWEMWVYIIMVQGFVILRSWWTKMVSSYSEKNALLAPYTLFRPFILCSRGTLR